MKVDFNSLNSLLKLSSKQQMVNLCQQAYLYRKRGPAQLPDALIESTAQLLDLSLGETKKCFLSLSHLLKEVMFQGLTDPQDIFGLFPSGFHKNLRDLLTKIILDNSAAWKVDTINNHVSLPKMVEFDWRVDMKTSSDSIARMSVPTCILNLQIEESRSDVNTTPCTEDVNVELSKETLDTMLDGLGRIRDQLASVANR